MIIPSWEFTKTKYDVYGAPSVEKARHAGEEYWDQSIRPQVVTVQATAQKQYEATISPYVSQMSSVILPYYSAGQENVQAFYRGRLVPAYNNAQPYILSAYGTSNAFVSQNVLPHARGAWDSSVALVYRVVLPKLRIVYGENVEPQIVKITERLADYREGKKISAAMDEFDAKPDASSTSSSLTSIASSASSLYASSSSSSDSASSSSPSASPSLSREEIAAQTRQKVDTDLKAWQDKFAKAADKGSEDLLERVGEITSKQINHKVHRVGDSMVVQLEELCASGIAEVRSQIISTIKSLPTDTEEGVEQKANDQIAQAMKDAGVPIREKAIALRKWKQSYDVETHSLVAKAAENTVAVLDSIRDVGLSEIGMRWAWMEGVTYKDWKKYHDMKDTLTGWRQEVEAHAFNHEGLQQSVEASTAVESKGMTIAEEAAKELNRLRDVGKWKIRAGDASDDFTSRNIPARARKVAQDFNDGIQSASEKIMGSSQSIGKPVTSAIADSAGAAASSASSAISGTKPGMAEEASSSLGDAGTAIYENVASSIQPNAESVAAAREKAEQIAHEGSKAMGKSGTPIHASVTSGASDSVSSASNAASSMASSVTSGSPSSSVNSGSSKASSAMSSVSSAASSASSKVFAGAMAQEVKGQKPILDDFVDDDATYSERLQSFVDQAGDKYAEITRAVNDALSGATTTQGTAESITSVANAQYSSALAAASSALYGTEKGTVESASSAVADKYADAVAA